MRGGVAADADLPRAVDLASGRARCEGSFTEPSQGPLSGASGLDLHRGSRRSGGRGATSGHGASSGPVGRLAVLPATRPRTPGPRSLLGTVGAAAPQFFSRPQLGLGPRALLVRPPTVLRGWCGRSVCLDRGAGRPLENFTGRSAARAPPAGRRLGWGARRRIGVGGRLCGDGPGWQEEGGGVGGVGGVWLDGAGSASG